ncbi:glucose-induced degradation protein 8 homolog isoform X1 [Hyalella azteca]|uniref:Glucose-induced degradation protein 8 homolog isoform X1 n=2 Tax=Hyalella azteca TaxID=294128 RepID=A0A8B7NHK8_HYAAZ|nr:glucose-induced degradation protein 8 homolog isoform X1 [Hyalella azteca]XP_047736387.1 glucose-induced degradation protein 8 homolog isoform X1 [Hyalella azteca]XP_047736410.1 glucose-induced degradation protein 8 homolog isoform X1 [Hyalella azteca]
MASVAIRYLRRLLNNYDMRGNSDSSEDMNVSLDGAQAADIKQWTEENSQTTLQRTYMNNLVMNYLVTEGFKEAAEKFAVEAGVTAPMDLSLMDERIRIRSAIQAGSIQEAMRMVTTLHPEILDDNSELYFHLQQLVLLELIREGRVEEAVIYAQEHLAERGASDPNVRQQLERTLALLAFPQPLSSPFADLLHPSHRQKVASELNAAILKAENFEETSPLLSELLKLLLWAQQKLLDVDVTFPVMTDLVSATLALPALPSANNK